MNLCILDACNFNNPNFNHEYNFKDYNSWIDGKWRSWHSIPALLKTEYFVYGSSNFNNCLKYDSIIILLDSEFQKIVPFLKKLKVLKKKIIISYHEGSHLVDNASLEQIIFLKEIVNEYADYYLNINVPTHGFWKGFFNKPIVSTFSCAPFEHLDWSQNWAPWEDKKDIFVTTRTLQNHRLKRDTFKALVIASRAAEELGCNVHYINEDWQNIPDDFLKRISDKIICHRRKEGYEEWLKFLTQFKVAFQLDNSNSVGQVVLDCAIAGTAHIGGNCDNNVCLDTNVLDTEKAFNQLIATYNNKLYCDNIIQFSKYINFNNLKRSLENIK